MWDPDTMHRLKKLIEVALPPDAIDKVDAREEALFNS